MIKFVYLNHWFSLIFHKMKKINGLFALMFCCLMAHSQEANLILPEGHLEKIIQIGYSPDGNYLVSASDDNTIKVWDVRTGRLLHNLSDHTDDILKFVFIESGTKIRSLSRDKTVRTWNIKTGELEFVSSGSKVVNTRAFINEKGTLVATTDMNDGIARIWDVTGKEWVLKYELPLNAESPLYLVCFSDNDKYVCTNYEEGKAAVWDLESGEKRFVTKNKGIIFTASFSNDNRKLITIISDTLSVWNIETGKLSFEVKKNNGCISCAKYSNNDSIIITGSTRGELRIFEGATGKLIRKIPANIDEISDIAISSDSRFVYSVDYEGLVTKSDLSTGKLISEFSTLYGSNSTMRFRLRLSLSPDEKTLAVTNFAGTVEIWNIADNRILHELKGQTSKIKKPVFSPLGDIVAVVSADFTVKVWNYKNASLLHSLKGHQTPIETLTFTPDGSKIITTSEDGFLKVWDVSTGRLLFSIEDLYSRIDDVLISPNGKYLFILPRWKNPRVYNILSGELLFELMIESSKFRGAYYSDSGSYLYVFYRENDQIKYLEINVTKSIAIDDIPVGEIENHEFDGHKTVLLLPDKSGLLYLDEFELNYCSLTDKNKNVVFSAHPMEITKDPFNNNGKLIVFDTYDGTDELHAQVCDIETGKTVYDLSGYTFNPNGGIEQPFSSDARWILTMDDSGFVRVWNAADGKLKTEIKCGDVNNILAFARFMPDNNTVMAGSFKVNEMQYIYHFNPVGIYDIETGNLIGTIPFEQGFPAAFCDSENIAAYCNNSQLVLYDTKTCKQNASYIALDNSEYIVITPEKYYKCSKNAAGKVLWRAGGKFYRFDQFDLQYNRPDIVLEKVGNPDTVLIKLYREAYKKRLRKSGFSENVFQPGWSCPEVEILNASTFPWITDKSKITLNIVAEDKNASLNRLNISVNEVPINGVTGIGIKTDNLPSVENWVEVDLCEGYNIIEVSCTNEFGVESFKENLEINYVPAVPHQPILHLIAVSVSEYADGSFNLTYPVKDGRDMVALLGNGTSGTSAIAVVDTLFNAMATRSNLLDMKTDLGKTNIDDIVILYLSGHGLLSDNLDFYYATYNVDFAHPELQGISYDELEWLLDGIPARKKLILIDACHSGELDRDYVDQTNDSVILADGTRSGLKTYSYKTAMMPSQQGNIPFNSAFELMQETFNDLSKGSGAVVISAASGTGFAIESPVWNNGVFTYAVISGLKELRADLNNDNMITVSELKVFVSNEVESLTRGRQKPSGRGESLLFDWKLVQKE